MPIPKESPIVEVASAKEAKIEVIGDELPGGKWAAYTDYKAPFKIVFKETPDFKTVNSFCTLTHELTHWFQYKNDVKPVSPAHYESQAYETQYLCFLANKDTDGARWARVQAVKYLLQNQ